MFQSCILFISATPAAGETGLVSLSTKTGPNFLFPGEKRAFSG